MFYESWTFFHVCNILITGFFQYEEIFEDFKLNSKKECLPRCLCRKNWKIDPSTKNKNYEIMIIKVRKTKNQFYSDKLKIQDGFKQINALKIDISEN